MKAEITQMNKLWEDTVKEKRTPTHLNQVNFNDIISEVFAAGPFYYYMIDFYDFSISNISRGFKEAHGVDPDRIKSVNDILAFTHPDDMPLVVKAEETALAVMKEKVGMEKITEYKFSYNFRFKTASGEYQLYNHQSLGLTTDEYGNFGKSINIHTNISHLTKTNNKKLSLIGLKGNPSYLNIDIFDPWDLAQKDTISLNKFSRRELQIIKLIADGCDTSEIAEQLYISLLTVKTHRKNILRKSGCKNAADLVARGISEGWI